MREAVLLSLTLVWLGVACVTQVDVVVDDDDKSTIARRRGATQRCHSGLLGMTSITLLYRDYSKERVMYVCAFDAGNAGCFELIPQYPTFEAHAVMRRARPLWRHV